jgi:hypothetical protein
MNPQTLVRRPRGAALAAALLVGTGIAASSASAQGTAADPRVGLRAGWSDAGQAARNMELVANRPRPAGFMDPSNMADFSLSNTDLAFQGDFVFVGSYAGFQVWDVSNPAAPTLRTSLVCPGGQGDVSVHANLLFMSVEETRGRIDCGSRGATGAVNPQRFRGVRIFDISNLDDVRQVAAVQTCRGSHTHTLVPDLNDPSHLYVYVSGTGQVRPGAELEGCVPAGPSQDPNTSYFRIEVIRVPLAAPQEARVVSEPRIFADPETGNVAGLFPGGDQGPGAQRAAQTQACHDITVYAEIGLAAGACSGNGILLDIRDPANPVRIDEVTDRNFAYWHSATFSNDGRTVIFTDEWGGGTQARCRETDRPEWGANALFHLRDGKLTHAGYYKLPAPQTATENCVAHNGSLVPVPGRDIKVQAWYQGGVSVFDFSDPANPFEIAFFDRGPMSDEQLVIGGYWSTYWYNGLIYGSEIGRGLDVLRLTPSQHLSQNEIDAANLVRVGTFNPQNQERIVWPAHVSVARAYVDQLERGNGLPRARITAIRRSLDGAERAAGPARSAALTRLAGELDRDAAGAADGARVRALVSTVRAMASSN